MEDTFYWEALRMREHPRNWRIRNNAGCYFPFFAFLDSWLDGYGTMKHATDEEWKEFVALCDKIDKLPETKEKHELLEIRWGFLQRWGDRGKVEEKE